jgi:tripartite-type tricarboxylate transporter receptor subunit TctC
MISMELRRRDCLKLVGTATALPAMTRLAWAQIYPTRPVRIVVGLTATSAPDVIARLIGLWLSEHDGQPFVIEDRPGAGTNIATEFVVRAAADGYTLLWITTSNMINATLYGNLNFNFIRDIAPVATVCADPFVMVVNPAFPAQTIAEFIAYAKANPGKINMASTGTGNMSHVSGELFKMMADVDMLHVPYRGELPAQADLLDDQVQVLFDPLISSFGYIKAGKMRALGVTTPKRLDALPNVPTVGEFVPGYEVIGLQGVGLPVDTPVEVIDDLSHDLNAALADPKIRADLADLGTAPVMMTPAEFSKRIADETDKWAKVIKFAGIKVE